VRGEPLPQFLLVGRLYAGLGEQLHLLGEAPAHDEIVPVEARGTRLAHQHLLAHEVAQHCRESLRVRLTAPLLERHLPQALHLGGADLDAPPGGRLAWHEQGVQAEDQCAQGKEARKRKLEKAEHGGGLWQRCR